MDESSKNPTPSSSPEEDARALCKAEEIRKDKSRMKALRLHHKALTRSLGMHGKGKRRERGARR